MRYLTLCLLLLSLTTLAQEPDAPGLEYVMELRVKLDDVMTVGQTPKGLRRIIPIIGGTVSGPGIEGEIVPGGSDWQYIRDDGVTELEAHYQFRTDDGTYIYIKNTGIRVTTPEVAAKMAAGESVGPDQYYFAAVPKFEAPEGKYHWLNNAIFICKGVKNPYDVSIFVWKVL